MSETTGDPFRIAEWEALPDVCLIAGCEYDEIDRRGPVWLRDGSMHKACTEHWEGVFRVLGRQAELAHGTDAYRAVVR